MVRLSDICDVRDGTHDSPKYVEYGYPLVTSKNIKDGQLDLSIVNFITEEDYNKINERSNVDVGDIIMPMIGTIGNPYLVEEFCDFAIKNVALIKCDNVKVINRFVWYFLQSNAFERYVDAKNKGGTQKFLSLGDIRTIELPVVSTDGQKNIIKILRCVDGIIEKRKQQLQKLDELVKARFVEMFGDPVRDKVRWEKIYLSEAGNCKNGMNFHADDIGIEINCLGVGDFKNLSIIDDTKKLPCISLKEYPPEDYLLQDEDIVFVRSNGNKELVGRCVVVYTNDIPTTYSGFCIRYRIEDTNLNVIYLLYVLRSSSVRKLMSGRGANIQNLNQQMIMGLEIPLPPLELQNQFAEFVQRIDKSKLDIQNSLDKLETLKKALMQKYFG